MFSAEGWQIQMVVWENCSTWWPLDISTHQQLTKALSWLDSFLFELVELLNYHEAENPTHLACKKTITQLFAYTLDLNTTGAAPLQNLIQSFTLSY